jgi:hypothetical protein
MPVLLEWYVDVLKFQITTEYAETDGQVCFNESQGLTIHASDRPANVSLEKIFCNNHK